MTMREINQLIEAVFEFNREACEHSASVKFRDNPKDGGRVWLWVSDEYGDPHTIEVVGFHMALSAGEDIRNACKRLADVIAEEKAARQE